MLIWRNFNEEECKRIARESGVKQTEKDVSYAAKLQRLHDIRRDWGQQVYCIRTEHAFLIGVLSSVTLRIIGIAIERDFQRQGTGRLLLNLAINDARRGGQKRITTLTKAGVEFYAKCGFDITSLKGEEFRMELKIE